MWVLEQEGKVLGYATAGRSRRAKRISGRALFDPVAEIWELYIDPEHLRRGYGRLLVESVVTALREQRFNRIDIWVVEGNMAARRAYESYGFKHSSGMLTENLGPGRVRLACHSMRLRKRRLPFGR